MTNEGNDQFTVNGTERRKSSSMSDAPPPTIFDEDAEDSLKKDSFDKMIIHFMIGFREICTITALLPLITLLVCFISAIIFQREETHETHCRVYNIIPSISAITGVSPQRYLWRISIALHIGPRFIIALCYRNYYTYLLQNISHDTSRTLRAKFLVALAFWLHFIEICALCGVTYVSNRENYPVHEKVFILFMTCSLCHMLATIKLCETLWPNGPPNGIANKSLQCKKVLFVTSIVSTITLLIFFVKHRLYCHDMAFSWFAFSEYVIACANMAFHSTTIWDFPCEHLFIARGAEQLKPLSGNRNGSRKIK